MAYILLPRSLFVLFIFSSTLNVMWGDKFIGNFLSNKIKNYMRSTANDTNHKKWMGYLERRLEIFCTHVSLQPFTKGNIVSILQSITIDLKRDILEKIYGKFLDVIQNGIFGSISVSSNNGEEVAVLDQCVKLYAIRLKTLSLSHEQIQTLCKHKIGKNICLFGKGLNEDIGTNSCDIK